MEKRKAIQVYATDMLVTKVQMLRSDPASCDTITTVRITVSDDSGVYLLAIKNDSESFQMASSIKKGDMISFTATGVHHAIYKKRPRSKPVEFVYFSGIIFTDMGAQPC